MLTPDELLGFIEELRQSGFNIGAEQYIAAQDMLLALATQAQRPYHVQRLRTYLAPIFCTTPKQQEVFYERFEQWLARKPVLAFTVPELETQDEPDSMAPREKVDSAAENDLRTLARRSRPWPWILAVSLILLTVVLIVILVTPPRPVLKTLSGIVVSNDSTAISGATISFLGQTTYSDSSGHFSFNHLSKDSSAELSISHPEFSPVLQAVALNREDTSRLQIQLSKPSTPIITIESSKQPPNTPSPIISLENSVEENPLLQLQDLVVRINTFADQVEREQQPQGWKRIYLDYFISIRFGVAILPLLLFGCWRLWQIYRRRLILEKRSTSSIPELQRMMVKGATDQLFRGPVFRRTAQQLRRHHEVISSELDASTTVDATIEKGGWFTPVYRGQQVLPEYLVLIDRISFQDQQARRVDEIILRLREDGVFIDRYYFDSDPRACCSADPKVPHFSLEELAVRHPDHRLMIFSDGIGLMHPLTGRPQSWLELFASWLDRALLTPVSTAQWRYREMVLSGLDFVVLPATQTGLATFVEMMQTNTPILMSRRNGSLFPEMLQERPKRFLERNAPEPMVVDQLCVQLREFLGNEGYDWLCACAVYPILAWDLTLYLGYRLTDIQGQNLLNEERLLALIRLPWFRHGSMPDWLRLRLIHSLMAEKEQEIRQALEDLLLSSLEQSQNGFVLDVARKLGVLKSRNAKRLLRDLFRTEPEDSLLHDFVFLAFMAGHKTRKLAVNLPKILQHFFFRKGQIILGMQPKAALIMAVLISFLGWNAITYNQPELHAKSIIPRFHIVEKVDSSHPLFLELPFAQSDSALNHYANAFFQQYNNLSQENSIIVRFLPKYPADSLAQSDTASIQRRFQFYEAWLLDTIHQATGVDSGEFSLSAATLLDSTAQKILNWISQPLYLTIKTKASSKEALSSIPGITPKIDSNKNSSEKNLSSENLSKTDTVGRYTDPKNIALKNSGEIVWKSRDLKKLFQALVEWMEANPYEFPPVLKHYMRFKNGDITSRVAISTSETEYELFMLCNAASEDFGLLLVAAGDSTQAIGLRDTGFRKQSFYLSKGIASRNENGGVGSISMLEQRPTMLETSRFYNIFLAWWDMTARDRNLTIKTTEPIKEALSSITGITPKIDSTKNSSAKNLSSENLSKQAITVQTAVESQVLSKTDTVDGYTGPKIALKLSGEKAWKSRDLKRLFQELLEWMKDHPYELPPALKRYMRFTNGDMTSRVTIATQETEYELFMLCNTASEDFGLLLVAAGDSTQAICLRDTGFRKQSFYFSKGIANRNENGGVGSISMLEQRPTLQETTNFYNIFLSWWDKTKAGEQVKKL